MPFAPIFEESTESELIPNVMAVVHRDFKDALDYWYAADNLPDFAVMTDDAVDEFAYPILSLANDGGSSNETSSGEWLDQELRFSAAIAVSGSTLKDVRSKIKKYRHALVAVIRKNVLEILPDGDQFADYTLRFRWAYFRHGTEGTEFKQAVQLETTITFGEK